MKILIVEDEPSLREIMYRALVQEHYVGETAATYADADAQGAGYSYDCILRDIMLPDRSTRPNGWRVYAACCGAAAAAGICRSRWATYRSGRRAGAWRWRDASWRC